MIMKIKQYKRIPRGFRLIKRGIIKQGDIVKYWYPGCKIIENCAGLVGLMASETKSDIYRKIK